MEDIKREKRIHISFRRAVCSVLLLILFCKAVEAIPKDYRWKASDSFSVYRLDILLLASCVCKIKLPERMERELKKILLVIAPAFCFWQIQTLTDNPIFPMKFLYAALNYLLMLTVFFVIYAITNRFSLTMIAGVTLFTFYGILYSFIREFRGNGLRAADIYAWKTALNVSEGYELIFSEEMCAAIFYAVAFLVLCCQISGRNKRKDRLSIGAAALCLVIGMNACLTDAEFMEENKVKPYLWELESSARDHGAFLDFAAGLPYLKVKTPKNYSIEKAEAIEERMGRKEHEGLKVSALEPHKKPHIIAIMNESFSDFRKLGALETDREVLENWDAMQENVIKGSVSVPIFGGWTANSEFEFLTGFSNAFFPSGVIPFQNYVKEGTPNLNQSLKKEHYASAFLHPMPSDGWNRKTVYETFEFDEALYLEEFKGEDMLRTVISDRGDYDKLIETYEKNKGKGQQFLFNVTIQNHGGYSGSGVERPVQILQPEGSYPEAEEYLTLLEQSDKALKELLDYFEREEEPVVVCMFGDHFPKVEEGLYKKLLDSSGAGKVERTAMQYQVPFMIYTNYDIEEKTYENISLNYLSTLLCNAAGLPLNGYQKYLAGLYEEFPVVNVYGVKNHEGQWFNWDEAAQFPSIREYEMVQYRHLFDYKKQAKRKTAGN